jgi:hypothetical protein
MCYIPVDDAIDKQMYVDIRSNNLYAKMTTNTVI